MLRENVGKTENIPEGNVRKFLALLIAFPRMMIYDIFRECDADIHHVNIEAYHRLKSNHWP